MPKTFGVRIVRVALSCSLAFASAVAFAGPYSDLAQRLHQAKSVSQRAQILKGADSIDDNLASYAVPDDPKTVQQGVEYVELRSMAENGELQSETQATKRIKSSPLYGSLDRKAEANWLAGAIERLKNLAPTQSPDLPGPASVPSGLGTFLLVLVWFLLGAAVIAFIVYAVRFVHFGRLKKRRAKAVLEDDEPERTLDEWLALAEEFERQGKVREAVRALYLACLLKFDERNVARFMRAQTNWEHLARIESSAKKPQGLDFRSPTQLFDRVWYGHKIRGQVDVDEFKAWYQSIRNALLEVAA